MRFVADGDSHGTAGLRRDARGCQLGAHPAGRITGWRIAAHSLDFGGQHIDLRDVGRGGVAAGIGGIETVDVGQQNKLIGADHLRDSGG